MCRHADKSCSVSRVMPDFTDQLSVLATVLEDQPDYDHLAQWKKSLIR
jgi:hypothetical protein